MATPSIKDDQIISAVQTRFKAITTVGGNYFYAYSLVYDGIPGRVSLEGQKLWAVNLRDVSDELIQEEMESGQQLQDLRLTLEIDIVVKEKSTTELRKMKADLLKSIGTDLTWGGLAFDTRYLYSQRNRRDAYGDVISDLTIVIEIHYRKNAWSAA